MGAKVETQPLTKDFGCGIFDMQKFDERRELSLLLNYRKLDSLSAECSVFLEKPNYTKCFYFVHFIGQNTDFVSEAKRSGAERLIVAFP